MNELRFDGRVAVVTGGGRGIGRAYALLLGQRGAKVVVNDLGGSMEGVGADDVPARQVADEIVDAGGAAVADMNDVSTEAGGQAIVDAAIAEFGRVDVVVNNAGIVRFAAFPESDLHNLQSHLDVHTIGSFHVTRAAWPHMVAQNYGRIVMTTSTGLLGLRDNLAYATAKAALIGMSRHIRIVGAPHDIKINLIAPAAITRMAGGASSTSSDAPPPERPEMAPELVAPMVAFLAHESCPVSGEIYTAGAGRFARIFIAATEGYVRQDAPSTIEDIAEHWTEVNDETGYSVPIDLFAWSAGFLKHLAPPRERGSS